MARHEVGIIGAAISGPVFALHLLTHPILRKRYQPILFEQLGPPDVSFNAPPGHGKKPLIHTAGAGVGLFPNGLFPLFELGLRQDLERISCEMADLDVWRGTLTGNRTYYNSMKNAGWDAELQTCPRIVERRRLRELLLSRIVDLGGQVSWNKKASLVDVADEGRIQVKFEDGETAAMDLLIGSDGAWSPVRKYVLEQKDKDTAEARWPANYTGIAGIYGISSGPKIAASIPKTAAGEYKAILVYLDRGNIGALPLEDGKIAWTLHVPDPTAPERSKPIDTSESNDTDSLLSKLVPGVYEPDHTLKILRDHQNIFHPELGSFKEMFESSERIIHSPLRQQVWNEHEIHHGNVALIGDAARVMPPYTGQGSSMGIEDATVLADAILNNPPATLDRPDFDPALTEYAARRVPRSRKLENLAAYAKTLTMADRWWWRWLRDLSARIPVPDQKDNKSWLVDSTQDWLFKDRLRVELRADRRTIYQEIVEGQDHL